MKSACRRSPLGIEKQFSLLNHCQQCGNLQSKTSKLEEELAAAKLYAQQCEDEAVELRRQLCSLHKELSKVKKSLEEANRKNALQLPDKAYSPQSNQSTASITLQQTQARPPDCMDTEEGKSKIININDSSLMNNSSVVEDCSDAKRKVIIPETEIEMQESAKRQRTVAEPCITDSPALSITLDECVDVIQDLVAVWSQRVDAMQRIECFLRSATISEEESDRVFKGFSAQVRARTRARTYTQTSTHIHVLYNLVQYNNSNDDVK